MTFFEFFVEYRAEFQRIVSLLIGLAMWRWGGAPERFIASIFVGLFTVPTALLETIFQGSLIFVSGGLFYVAIDVLAAVAFVSVALNANRNYTLWIAGFQVVATAAHAVRLIVDVVTPLAYAIMVISPSYFQLILMVAGLIRHMRRKKRFGKYRDWRISPQHPWDLAHLSNGPRGGV